MNQQPRVQGVTLFDMTSGIAFATPIFTGVIHGNQFGLYGILIGLGFGPLIGIACFSGFRRIMRICLGEKCSNWLAAPVMFACYTIFLFLPGGLLLFGMDALFKQQVIPTVYPALISLLILASAALFIWKRL